MASAQAEQGGLAHTVLSSLGKAKAQKDKRLVGSLSRLPRHCSLSRTGVDDRFGSIATGRGKLQVQPCPQCPVSDGRPEKGGLR